MDNQRAVEPLIETLGDGDWSVRQVAVEALGEIGDPRAVEPLIQTLEDRDCDVRQAAVEALGEIGDPRAVEPLIVVLERDKVRSVRKAAVKVLARIYRKGKLDAFQKQRILALEGTQILGHRDKWGTGCSGGQHFDEEAIVFEL